MGRALGMHELAAKKYEVLDFDGRWLESFGKPAANFTMIVWGLSGQGKTRFVLKLVKYLTRFGKVGYDSLEEGDSRTLQLAFIEEGMLDVKGKIILIDRERLPELIERLDKRKSPRIVVVDSIQYTAMSYTDHQRLKERYPNKIFIYISHAEGKEPDGKSAKKIRYDCDVKVYVHQYKANIVSRFGGNKPFVIWDKKAAELDKQPGLFDTPTAPDIPPPPMPQIDLTEPFLLTLDKEQKAIVGMMVDDDDQDDEED